MARVSHHRKKQATTPRNRSKKQEKESQQPSNGLNRVDFFLSLSVCLLTLFSFSLLQ
jgi:hypothetical protein